MNIGYDVPGFNGGASQSLKQYIRIAKEDGHRVIVFAHSIKNKGIYDDLDVEIIKAPLWRFSNPFKWFYCYFWYSRAMHQYNIDVLHVNRKESFILARALKNGLGLPVLFMKAGYIPGLVTTNLLLNQEWVVYSEENKVDMCNLGLPSNAIEVWPQRFDFRESKSIPLLNFSNEQDQQVRCAWVGRLGPEKMGALRTAIQMVAFVASKGISIRLDIYGAGSCESIVSSLAEDVNKKFDSNIIILHGFKYPITDFIKKAHIVFGKGRSVIEPCLLGNFGIVVGEDGKWLLVTPLTFDHLCFNNFSGRHIEISNTKEEFLQLTHDISIGSYHELDRQEVKNRVIDQYDVETLRLKLVDRYCRLKNSKKEGRYSLGLISILYSIYLTTRFLLKRKPKDILW